MKKLKPVDDGDPENTGQRSGEPGKGEMNRDLGEKETRRDSGREGPAKGEGQMPHGPTIHNGSAGAFDATEDSADDDDEYQDNDDFAMDA